MPEPTTYSGGCHCGAVRFRVKAAIESALTCNCSICSKTGTALVFVPAGMVELLSGEGELTDYQFGKKHIHHLFCRRCGIRSFARGAAPDGSQVYAVNVRCLDGVDLGSVPMKSYDGKSIPIDA